MTAFSTTTLSSVEAMSSPKEKSLDSLFTSNRRPSYQESTTAGELLQFYDEKLRVTDARIVALEHELDELKAQRLDIEGERRRYTNILSARRLIPTEIISQFMELACVDSSTVPQPRGVYQQILSFMLVSREWYRTACSVAHFWTELDMDFTKYSVEGTRNIILNAKSRSARAAKLPLSLTVAFSGASPTNSQVIGLIHSLKLHLGLLHLRIQVSSASELQILDSLFHHPTSSGTLVWPMLHTLRISVQLTPENDGIKAASKLFIPSANFPLLRATAISSTYVTFPSLHIPWSNLLTLDLGLSPELEMRQYILILGQCTNLKFLCLRMQGYPSSEEINDPTMLTLGNLTHLELENSDSQVRRMGKLLSLLKLPYLQSCTYTVMDGGGYYTPIVRQLNELFQRSGCSESMEYLELNLSLGLSVNPATLGNLFRQVPRLTVLKLSGYKMDGNALRDVPHSVRDLSIKLSYYRIDDARSGFVDYLHYRFDSSDAPIKAQLHIVDTVLTAPTRERLETLKKDVGSSLDVVMD